MRILLLSLTLTLYTGAGCASHTTKTTQSVTTTEQPAPEMGGNGTDEARPGNKAVTTTTTQSDESSPGIIGSAFHLVWAVISFPFRVIGDLV